MSNVKRRGRPQLVVNNSAVMDALNAGSIRRSTIRAVCLHLTDGFFSGAGRVSAETLEDVLKNLSALSVVSIEAHTGASSSYSQRVLTLARKAHDQLIQFI